MRPRCRSRSVRAVGNWQRLGVRGTTAAASALALMSVGAVVTPSAATQNWKPGQVPDGSCDAQVVVLPGLTSTSLTAVAAMSDSGLVVGTSRDPGASSAVVVWTSPDRIIHTGVGGGVSDNGNTVSAWAVDVNEAGVVAINRTTSAADGRILAEDAVLWTRSSGATVLAAPAFRPRASVVAINDEGDAVGRIWGRGHGSVPVIWSDGKRTRLPVPPQGTAVPADINNEGLVVGTSRGRYRTLGLWTWHGGTTVRLLASPERGAQADVTGVDDSGRIVGGQPVGPADGIRTILWRNRDALPRRLMRIDTRELHNSGYLAAVEPGFRGIGATAYVGHRRDGGLKARLPDPPDGGPSGWNNVYAVAVARGPSAFAPQGGVTIAGSAQDWEYTTMRGILWTCAHTLL